MTQSRYKYKNANYANYADHWVLANSVLPKTSIQQRRLVSHLLSHQRAITVDINQACSIGNISDAANKANKHLLKVGLFIGCELPPVPITNQFNEESQMHQWFVLVLPSPTAPQENLTAAENEASK